jgi:hypothetical protein
VVQGAAAFANRPPPNLPFRLFSSGQRNITSGAYGSSPLAGAPPAGVPRSARRSAARRSPARRSALPRMPECLVPHAGALPHAGSPLAGASPAQPWHLGPPPRLLPREPGESTWLPARPRPTAPVRPHPSQAALLIVRNNVFVAHITRSPADGQPIDSPFGRSPSTNRGTHVTRGFRTVRPAWPMGWVGF